MSPRFDAGTTTARFAFATVTVPTRGRACDQRGEMLTRFWGADVARPQRT